MLQNFLEGREELGVEFGETEGVSVVEELGEVCDEAKFGEVEVVAIVLGGVLRRESNV